MELPEDRGRAAVRDADQTSAPKRAAEEIRTFLVADVRGYTAFTQEHGDEAAAGLVAKFAAVVREHVEARDGSVGDGLTHVVGRVSALGIARLQSLPHRPSRAAQHQWLSRSSETPAPSAPPSRYPATADRSFASATTSLSSKRTPTTGVRVFAEPVT
jgi:class 3 adenylate cyclase